MIELCVKNCRFWKKVRFSGDCWIWTGFCDKDGYGTQWYEGKKYYAHRLSYILTIGPIPAGYEVHHTCKNRPCVNPFHLQTMTIAEHKSLDHLPKGTHCKRGHKLVDDPNRDRQKCFVCESYTHKQKYLEKKRGKIKSQPTVLT